MVVLLFSNFKINQNLVNFIDFIFRINRIIIKWVFVKYIINEIKNELSFSQIHS